MSGKAQAFTLSRPEKQFDDVHDFIFFRSAMGVLLLFIGMFVAVYFVAHLVGCAWPALGNLLHSQKSWVSFFVFVLACWKLRGDLYGDTKTLGLGLFIVALGISFLDKKKRF